MKGIVLAGGAGTRLSPMTSITTKQLLPIYDKPMVYYPLSLLMLCGINEILLISTPRDLPSFQTLLGDGSELGMNIQYAYQSEPKGIAEAFIIGEEFIAGDDVALILGDNLFYGDYDDFRQAVSNQKNKKDEISARVFAYQVSDPSRYGVVEFEKKNGKVKSIEEKPKNPKSSFAIPGLYFFDETVSERAKSLTPSARGEIEITDVMNSYFQEDKLGVEVINRGMAWLDTGTPESLLDASAFIAAIEQRQGLKVACLEEVALRMSFVDTKQFQNLLESYPKSYYRDYLEMILKEAKEET